MDFTDYDTRLAAYAVIVDADEQVLLAWWNGEGHSEPGWTLPGGGVELEESVEEAVIREVHEETGFHVRVGAPLVVHSWSTGDDPARPRPYKAVRIVFEATITGGVLGTVEVGGSTDRAGWVPLAEVAQQSSRTDIVDVALAAWHRRVA